MKTTIFFIIIMSGIMHITALAQDKRPASPSWVSEKGWWVVESNIHTPKQCIVYFYNNDGVLVYREKIEGLRINPAKRITKMQLKQVLETSVLAWEHQHPVKENEALVLNQLRKK